eukprot:TRINITY_DN9621_c0_g1_i3.p1 TRINITY_DN9621_c0_g1~~TRINITY_DN9621_c0_g1_i3.p1  ORF type:complete len:591 (+),score=143.04 TRINITY_DN9621_c0_g1_i3:49-1821(+)
MTDKRRFSSYPKQPSTIITPLGDSSPPLKVGWLRKQAKLVRQWNRRWFILTKSVVQWADDEESKTFGQFPLKQTIMREVSEETSGRKYCFELTCGEKAFLVASDTQADYDDWMKAFKKAASDLVSDTAELPPLEELESMFRSFLEELGLPAAKKQEMEAMAPERKWLLLCQNKSREQLEREQQVSSGKIHDTPAGHINNLKAALTAENLSRLGVALRSKPVSWVSQFINLNGAEFLVEKMVELDRKPSKASEEWDILVEIFHCLKSMINNEAGVVGLLNANESVSRICLGLKSESMEILAMTCQILAATCLHSADGYDLVIQAFDNYCEVVRESRRFEHLIRSLRLESDDIAVSVMALINVMLNETDDLTVRLNIRSELVQHGLIDVIGGLRRGGTSEYLEAQIVAFEDALDADTKEAKELFGDVITVINDPTAVFHSVNSQVQSSPCSNYFLDALKSFHSFYNDEQDGVRMWWTCNLILGQMATWTRETINGVFQVLSAPTGQVQISEMVMERQRLIESAAKTGDLSQTVLTQRQKNTELIAQNEDLSKKLAEMESKVKEQAQTIAKLVAEEKMRAAIPAPGHNAPFRA